jgi:hypothetical protein
MSVPGKLADLTRYQSYLIRLARRRGGVVVHFAYRCAYWRAVVFCHTG